MIKRNYKHLSPLDKKLAKGKKMQKVFVHILVEQKTILKHKPCGCFIKAIKNK